MSRLHALTATAALALGLTACSPAGDALTDPTAPPPPATTSAPAPEPVAEETTPAPEQEPTTGPDFMDWLAEGYVGVSWLDLVASAEERFGVLWIETDLYPDAEAEETAKKICTAGKAYALDAGDPYNGNVSVRAVGGQRAAEC